MKTLDKKYRVESTEKKKGELSTNQELLVFRLSISMIILQFAKLSEWSEYGTTN